MGSVARCPKMTTTDNAGSIRSLVAESRNCSPQALVYLATASPTGGRLRSRLGLRPRGRSSMVEPQPSKLVMRVRSPPPALGASERLIREGLERRGGRLQVSRLEPSDDLAGERERLALLLGREHGVHGRQMPLAVVELDVDRLQ